MNKLKLLLMALGITGMLALANTAQAAPGEIGVVNFKKIASNYTYAKNVAKEIDDEVLKLNQYLLDKDKELKAIESPIAKKNFEEKTIKEYKVKEDTLLARRAKVDQQITDFILNATKVVAQQKALDTVFDYRVIVVGGKDITEDVIKYLNAQPAPKK